uniref:Coiled-coil domain-containing protein 25 n=1 Tax=Rhabditophanes sp. KR3021 TaxID=114890 RepID=A0AC35TK51_9BILA
MVRYFTSTVTDPPATLYVGRDKEENEDLIKFGWPEDVWFHVDKLSSAHVYVRMPKGQGIDDMSQELIDDCACLVKANSISGCKLPVVDVVFTPWSNLKKDNGMASGQVGFHYDKRVKRCKAEKRNDIVNRLNKTEVVQEVVDFRALREERDAIERREIRKVQQVIKANEDETKKKRLREKEMKSYDKVFVQSKMSSNQDGNDSDDFM